MKRALLVALTLAGMLALARLARDAGGGDVLLPQDPPRDSNRAGIEREEPPRAAREADIELVPPAAGERSDFEALALRAGSLEPVAGARLWCWSEPELGPPALRERFERALEAGELEALLARLGAPTVADAAGRARLDAPARGGFAIALAPGLLGQAWAAPDEPGLVRVELVRDSDLFARVVDPRGAPVEGAIVSLRTVDDGHADDWMRVASDADGLARLRHIGSIELPPAAAAPVLALAELLDPPVERAFERDAPPSAPIELIAPDAGACELLVVDASGAPWTAPLELWIQLLPADGEEEGPLIDVTRAVLDGRVRLEHVTPGRELRVSPLSATLGAQDVVVAGPRAIGQRVTRTVRVEARTVTLLGRAVDERGAPLRALELEASLERGRIEDRLATLSTDGVGRFELDLPTELGQLRPHALVLARRLDSGEELASGRAPLPSGLTLGRNELGDVRLAPSPVLASGVVVDARGAPVPGTEVRRFRGEAHREDPTRVAWRGLAPQRADARGRFVVRGEEQRDTLALSAARDGALSAQLEVAVGARDVVLQLGGVGAIAGRVLLDPSVDPRDVELVAHGVDPQGQAIRRSLRPLPQDGRFELRGVPAGAWELDLSWRSRTTLAELDPVQVVPDLVIRDPRLGPLDLRAAWRVLTLRVTDERGGPIRAGRVVADFAGGAWALVELANGRASLLSGGAPAALRVEAHGYLTARLGDVDTDLALELRDAPRVELALIGVPPPAPPLRIRVELEPAADPPFDSDDSLAVELDAHGRARCRPPFAGRARVRLDLAPPDAPRVRIEPDGERFVDIADDAVEQRLELPVGPAALAEAARRLGE